MTRSAQDDSVRYESSHVARHCKDIASQSGCSTSDVTWSSTTRGRVVAENRKCLADSNHIAEHDNAFIDIMKDGSLSRIFMQVCQMWKNDRDSRIRSSKPMCHLQVLSKMKGGLRKLRGELRIPCFFGSVSFPGFSGMQLQKRSKSTGESRVRVVFIISRTLPRARPAAGAWADSWLAGAAASVAPSPWEGQPRRASLAAGGGRGRPPGCGIAARAAASATPAAV